MSVQTDDLAVEVGSHYQLADLILFVPLIQYLCLLWQVMQVFVMISVQPV